MEITVCKNGCLKEVIIESRDVFVVLLISSVNMHRVVSLIRIVTRTMPVWGVTDYPQSCCVTVPTASQA